MEQFQMDLAGRTLTIETGELAKQAGGGGHKRACGFSVEVDQVLFTKDRIIFIDKKPVTIEPIRIN